MGERLVVRQRLELDPGWTGGRMRVVWDQIATPDFQRVHADLGGGQLNQPLGDRGRNRMADRTILAHDILVLKHDPRTGAVVGADVRPPGEVDDLVRLDARRARVNRVRADAGEIIDFPGGDGTVVLDADLGFDAMIAGMDFGDEALDAI